MPEPTAIRLANMKIRTRLAALTGFLLLAMMVVGCGGWYVLHETVVRSQDTVERAETFETAVNTARTAQVDFKKQIQEWKDILLRGREQDAYDKYARNFEAQSDATRLDLEDLRAIMKHLNLATDSIEQALKTHHELVLRYQEALRHYEPTVPDSAYRLDIAIRGIDRAPTDQIDKIVADILEQSNRSVIELKKDADERYRIAFLFLLCITMGTMLAGFAVTYWQVRSITIPLHTALRIARTVADGNLDTHLDVQGEDETAQLLRSLMEMNTSLLNSRIAAQDRDWIKSSHNDLYRLMRSGHEVQSMTEKILSYVVERVDAQIGSFYLHDEHGQNLHLVASCGLPKKTRIERERITSDDGYIARAFSERTVLIANDIPHQYLNIESTLGSAQPRYIATIPLIHGDNLVGLMEIAGFQQISPLQHELLDSAKDSIAIGFEVSLSHQKTQMLLIETEQQAEELRVQQEELQQSNEELEERAEMLAMQREQIRAKNTEIEEASAEIMRKADDLERVSTYKSEFLANMSHELRTPLNSMLILSGLLKENKAKNLTAKQVEYASTINSAGLDLLNLINDILDLSKVEAGQVEFQYEDEVPITLCDSMRRLFQLPIEQKGLHFSAEIAPNVPPRIHIDVQRTLQILKNLIGNAVKFTREGSIGLRLYLAQEKDNPLGVPALAYAVTDTGIGVPAQKQALVFEAFKQADGGISRKFGGTGLGLSISLQLARRMDGDLKMVSEEGRGTTMTLYLPLATESTAPVSNTQQIPPIANVVPNPIAVTATSSNDRSSKSEIPADNRRILIVEDDHAFAEILSEFVEQHGFKPVLASDGESGIRLARELLPSAILLDVMLPKIDGWGVMRSLKDASETRHIPVHFITCMEDRKKAMEMGAIGFVTKPVSPDQLDNVFQTIESAIDKSVKKLLIVEDDEREAMSLVDLLSGRDVTITVAATGQEAIAYLAADRFDCMVLDLGLADMSGFDVLAHMQSLDRARQLPVIVHSGHDLTRDQERELHRYAQSIIIKGAKSPERLLNEVTLFLHMVESRMAPTKREMIRAVIDTDVELGGRKVLIVDDDMRNIFSLTSLLTDKGIVVVEAENGKEALTQLEKQDDICLVLMDIMMPDMDGFEAMRHIRKNPKWASLPVIAMTAKVMKGDSEKCLEAGASDYIGKPIESDKLMSMLRVWGGR